MSMLVQDLIVSFVALGAVTTIGIRARAMFATKRSGAGCPSCTKCPATNSVLPANLTAAAGLTLGSTEPADTQRVIRLTVVQ